MKILFLFLLVAFSFPAHAQTPVSKEQANAYFANCVKAPPQPGLSAKAQQMVCACTAARMTQFFTIEDMKTATTPNAPGQREAFNRMMVDVYAPCMEEPTREYHYNACITNPQSARYGNPQIVCECMATQVANHMKTNGAAVFRDILARNPNIVDPMSALADDPAFTRFAQSKLLACIGR